MSMNVAAKSSNQPTLSCWEAVGSSSTTKGNGPFVPVLSKTVKRRFVLAFSNVIWFQRRRCWRESELLLLGALSWCEENKEKGGPSEVPSQQGSLQCWVHFWMECANEKQQKEKSSRLWSYNGDKYCNTGKNWFWKNSTTILLDTLAIIVRKQKRPENTQ